MSPDESRPLLRVRELTTYFDVGGPPLKAVDGVSFEVHAGERLAIVGESGSGKSVTAMSIAGLVARPGRHVRGSVELEGSLLTGMRERDLAPIRGAKIGYVFQDAQGALNPLRTVGSQLVETLRLHHDASRTQLRRRAADMLEQVGLGNVSLRMTQYPHELSGGMNQRVMIAMALAGDPQLLIADEPTTALDATTEVGILQLITSLAESRGLGVVLISHDLGAVSAFADRVLIMYAGRIVESGTVSEVFLEPKHPYTAGLLASMPGRTRGVVSAMAGTVPNLADLPPGCAFQPRCVLGGDREPCRQDRPTLALVDAGHESACFFPREVASVVPAARVAAEVAEPPTLAAGDVIKVENLVKHFTLRRKLFGRDGGTIKAVDGVSFAIRRGETLALVGESGSGKTTTARVVLGLESSGGGAVRFRDQDLTRTDSRTFRQLRRHLQVIFQSPDSSLDSKMKVGDIIAEPLVAHGIGSKAENRARARELLVRVGLQADDHDRFPAEFSGGQKQRIGIARALVGDPELVVCDEPVTALDVSVQANILNLLYELQQERGISYLLIAHDLAVVRQMADTVAVMYLGQIVEQTSAARFFAGPAHPFSVALFSTLGGTDPTKERHRKRISLSGVAPSAIDPPPGCRFHTRCWKATDLCRVEAPPLSPLAAGHLVSCHFPETAPPDPLDVEVGPGHD